MPDVGTPDDWPARPELRAAYVEQIPEKYREDFLRERPIELREVAPRDFFKPEKTGDRNQLWFRMAASKGQDPQMQHCLLAYASDMNLLGSSLRPHALTWFQGRVMSASLDHAMWFHAPIEFSDWHLYDLDAPWTGGARGFNRGSIYREDGALVASVAQEGLMRPLKGR